MTSLHTTRRYARVLGATAALFCLLQVLVNSYIALAAEIPMVTLQRSLAGLAQGNGVSIDAFAGPVGASLLVSMLVGLVTLLIVVGFCWYAGRIAAGLTGTRQSGGMAGRQVVLVSGLVWIAASLVAVLSFHADASISWLVATLALVITAPGGATANGLLVTAPSNAFTAVQVGALLVQQWFSLLAVFGLGTLAGHMGAASFRTRVPVAPPGPPHMPAHPQPFQPLSYLPGYPPSPGAYPPAWNPPPPGTPPPPTTQP